MEGHDQLVPEKREEGIVTIRDYLRGGGQLKSLVENQSDLKCSELKSDLAQRISNTKPEDQTSLHFRLSLYRSLRYATASSHYCRSLSRANELRQRYEGQRLLLLHPQA
jgi:hypothetical protein